MAGSAKFTIGDLVRCTDGVSGQVTRVIVDPIRRTLTHLVVEAKHSHRLGRLVPVDLVDTSAGEVRLSCTRAEFDKLAHAEEEQFLPGSNGYGGYEDADTLSWPYYGLGIRSGVGIGGGGAGLGFGPGYPPRPLVYDVIPAGDVTVRRGESVRASDGAIGKVQGLVISPEDHHVTHVLLQEGHLWGRRQVTIPISAVTALDDGVCVNLTRQQVEDLPSVDIEPPRPG